MFLFPRNLFYLGSSDVICQPEGKTQLPKMGEVPTYVNTQHIDVHALVALQANSDTVINGTAGTAKDSPRKDIFDMSKYCYLYKNLPIILAKIIIAMPCDCLCKVLFTFNYTLSVWIQKLRGLIGFLVPGLQKQ